MRAACIQFQARAEKAQNLEDMAPLVAQAADLGADVILLPEKWNAWLDGPGLRDALDQLDAWERAEAQLQQARTELAKASDELHTLSRQGGGIRPPTFEVLQSTDRESKPKDRSLFGGQGQQ